MPRNWGLGTKGDWLMAGKCGTCTACCRVFAIPELDKPAGKWCQHCDIGVGCKIYENRPERCIDFKCMWLLSFEHIKGGWSVEQRPDKCKVVFAPTTNPHIIAGTTFPGTLDAWHKGEARKIIDNLLKAGVRVVIGPPNSTTKIMVDQYGEHEVKMTEPDANGMQWNIKGG